MTRAVAFAWLAAALLACSAAAFGTEALFTDYHAQLRLLEQRQLLFHDLPQWTVVLNLVAALTLVALWRVRSDIPHYFWLLGASLCGNGWFLQALGVAPGGTLLPDVLITAWFYCLARILYPTLPDPAQRTLSLLPLAVLLVYGVAALLAQPVLHGTVTALCALGLWLASSRQLGAGLRRQSSAQSALTLGVWLIALCVLVDTLLVLADVHLAQHPDHSLQTATVAQMIGVLLALYFLVASHGENLHQLAALNTSLDQRVQEAEAEFADRYAMLTHDALDAAALRERKTIYQSIHEDLSDKLLQLIYSASNPATADLARAALAELRDSRKLHPEQAHALADVLADAFAEAQTRCEQAALALDWHTDDTLQHCTLTARQESALRRTLREALSNLLKHAQARRVTVTATVSAADAGPTLIYAVSDDGRGIAPTHRPGRGLVNMRNRMQELGGSVTIAPGATSGTRLQFTLPLRRAEEPQP